MSQTNAFSKAQNPDYVYLDLQQTNVYNNTNAEDIDINFIETRDNPVIANTGDYHLSVTRFQIDTYKLPSLIVEPDLTTVPFLPNKTIHKVAIMTDSATQLNTSLTPPILSTELLNIYGNAYGGGQFGFSTGYADLGEMAAIGSPTFGGFGLVFANSLVAGSSGLNPPYLEGADLITGSQLGQAVCITRDARYLVAIQGDGVVASGTVNLIGNKITVWQRVGTTGATYTVLGKRSVDNVPNPAGPIIVGRAKMAITSSFPTGFTFIFSSYRPSAIATTPYISITRISGIITTGAEPIYGVANTSFGTSLACSYNGYNVVIGCPSITGAATQINVARYNPAQFEWQAPFSPNTFFFTYNGSANPSPAGPAYTSDDLGTSVAISGDGNVIVAGAPSAAVSGIASGRIAVFRYNGTAYVWQQNLTGPVGSQFGYSLALNETGNVLSVGCGAGAVDVYIYNRTDDTDLFVSPFYYSASTNTQQADQIGMNAAGNKYLMGDGEVGLANGRAIFYENVYPTHYVDYLPSSLRNIASVVNVTWEPSLAYPAPQVTSLTGKNTVKFPYYYCNSYEYFVNLVNKALMQASADNYNYLWTQYWSTASNALKSVFFDAAYKSFPTPPFLDWNASALSADLYVNQCYNNSYNNNAVPPISWTGSIGTMERPPPLTFNVAMNASLYALFSSFPATETILTTTTGEREKFYIIDITSPGFPMTLPNPTINKTLYSSYIFNTLIYSTSTFSYTINPSPVPAFTTTYTYANQFIKQSQELSTIDVWCPVNSIVFTTNTLPIIVNQFSSNATINAERMSSETGAEFALIITDLQTNQQGYKPNVLYTPSAEYRRIDMTGNNGLTNIDIRVFWRAKTGQLIPFKLSSGASTSIKLLFQKKLLAEKQQMQLQQFSVKDLGL